MKTKALLAAAVLALGAALPAHAEESALPGDIVTGVMPLVTYGIARFKDDGKGEGEFWRNLIATEVTVSALRYGLKDTEWSTRPNGHPYGFPSGHAGFVGANAAYLWERFGWEYGVPAYLAAGYVDWNRVETGHHRWRDVIAAHAIAIGMSKLFVTPADATFIAPTVGPDWMGLRIERSF